MGILIGLEHISQEWPGKQVLRDQTIGIHEGDRIGIVGRNGDGKSTLLELIARSLTADEGQVVYRGNITVGIMDQNDALQDDDTVEHSVVGDAPEYVWASNPQVRSIISHLLGGIPWQGRISELSGGQRRRVDLARLLMGSYDVLLLDEPTNHLDVEAITWLADHLKHRWPDGSGALLCVTHDRWFLDEVCTSMWEVHDGVIDPFEGGYSAYIQQRAERARLAQVKEERRQNILRKELAWLARGPKARTSKPKFRIEEAKALVNDVPPMRNPLELRRMAVSRLGKQVVELKDVSFAYGGQPILDHMDWLIGPGDRVGILGENGAGKSTLLNIIQGKLQPDGGLVKIGKSVKFGILSQRLDVLEERKTWRVKQLLERCKSSYMLDGKEVTPLKLLERLGFDQSDYDSIIGDLSGGQKRRLAIMYVLLQEPNVLILDEPGNDLDTDMLAILEDLLDQWPGTLFLVSHDRYMMERVTDDQYALEHGHLTHLPGGVDQYLETQSWRKGSVVADGVLPSSASSAVKPDPVSQAPSGMSNQKRRELRKRFDAIDRKLKKLQEEPGRIKEEMSEMDPTNFIQLADAQKRLDQVTEEIDSMEMEWLELADVLNLDV